MKNDCLVRFIADGLLHHGSKLTQEELMRNLISEIFPSKDDDSEIPPIQELQAISNTRRFLSRHIPKCRLGFTPIRTIPYSDYTGFLEDLARNNAYLGLGYDPKRLFNGNEEVKHVSTVIDFNRHGATIQDPELPNKTFCSWEDVERDTFQVNGGFWHLTQERQS